MLMLSSFTLIASTNDTDMVMVAKKRIRLWFVNAKIQEDMRKELGFALNDLNIALDKMNDAKVFQDTLYARQGRSLVVAISKGSEFKADAEKWEKRSIKKGRIIFVLSTAAILEGIYIYSTLQR